MKSSKKFGGFIFLYYLCINKKEQHYENQIFKSVQQEYR